MMIPEVDKSDLSTYFLSYGDVDSVKKREISELPKTPDEFITDLKAVKDSPLFH